MSNLRFVNVVWGEAYTDTFVNVCLPSSLSAGNLEYIAARSESSYRIYTTPKDAETILASPAGQKLAKMMKLEIVRVDAALPVDNPAESATSLQKYSAMSLCHTHFIRTAGTDGSAMVFLSPDLFWADGSFRRLFEIVRSGKRLLMMGALRLAKESFVAALQQHHTRDGNVQPLAKRDLVRLAMQHLHPETESLVWESGNSNVWPSLLLWKNLQQGLMLRAFHLHPLMVRPSRRDVFPAVTIDDDYIAHVCPDPGDEHVVCDSDDMVAFELSRRTARAELILPTEQNCPNVAAWARSHANVKHRKFVEHQICLHSADISDAWHETQARSDRAVQEILSLIDPQPALVAS